MKHWTWKKTPSVYFRATFLVFDHRQLDLRITFYYRNPYQAVSVLATPMSDSNHFIAGGGSPVDVMRRVQDVMGMDSADVDEVLAEWLDLAKTDKLPAIPLPGIEDEHPDTCPDCKVPGAVVRTACICAKCGKVIWGC
jgi:hypothetical protein